MLSNQGLQKKSKTRGKLVSTIPFRKTSLEALFSQSFLSQPHDIRRGRVKALTIYSVISSIYLIDLYYNMADTYGPAGDSSGEDYDELGQYVASRAPVPCER